MFVCDTAEARQRRVFRGRARAAVQRVVEVPRRVVQFADDRVALFDGDAPERGISRGKATPKCGNPECDCVDCQCENCDCGTRAPAAPSEELFKERAPEDGVTGADDSADCNDTERRMVAAINEYRARHGKGPLRVDRTLMRMARQRCPAFSHNQRRFGGWVRDQASRLGYIATDNIADGYPTGESAVGDEVSGWGDKRPGHSVGHDKQMLGLAKVNGRWIDEQYDSVGVAKSGLRYIAIFGRKT